MTRCFHHVVENIGSYYWYCTQELIKTVYSEMAFEQLRWTNQTNRLSCFSVIVVKVFKVDLNFFKTTLIQRNRQFFWQCFGNWGKGWPQFGWGRTFHLIFWSLLWAPNTFLLTPFWVNISWLFQNYGNIRVYIFQLFKILKIQLF